jgi:glycosyltransferase involved in cell wall biosynthesis
MAEKLSRELEIIDRVIFFGKVRETNHILPIADLFLLPSETESFGLAALEAMAVGVPVISSNTGGIPEVNEHGFSGYISNVGETEIMANYALDLLTNDEKLNQFKHQAIERAQEFSLDKILPLYESLYKDVMNQ